MQQQLKISFLCCGGACVGVLMAACMIITQYSQYMSLYNSCVCGLVFYFLAAQAVHFLSMSQILAFLTEFPCKMNTDAPVFVVFIIYEGVSRGKKCVLTLRVVYWFLGMSL